ncbi:galactose-1-phosphate uridylyltransferase [Salinactinospora qingdaonensis]|uniref:Galactose-1-phosphate uridylyltransferase n=1 Tax=Salinactinospora qingdaonensis TaxID=702744 RepID=A0ABP7GJD1_9ACTN
MHKLPVWRSTAQLADGREISYYDETPDTGRATVPDRRPLDPAASGSELRHDPLLDEWVALASHRQNRTFLPPPDQCPLDPTSGDNLTEVPAADYDVAVFENRFPSFARSADHPAPAATPPPEPTDPALRRRTDAGGRCEVVCFTAEHNSSFAQLRPHRVATVIEALADRTEQLSALPEVACVYPFENRGEEIGVTLHHPHGQIYGYPFVPPRMAQMLATARRYREQHDSNLFDDVVAAEHTSGRRVVASGRHWIAFVPAAARWPYEVKLFPLRRTATLPLLDAEQRAELAHLYLGLVRAFDGLFDSPTPYIAAWHQAPFDTAGAPDPDFGLHLQLFTLRRAPGKMKYLAGSESGMAAWINDVAPEDAAHRLRAAYQHPADTDAKETR